MTDASRQIKIGAIISYVSIAINIVVGLLYTPWMISQIGEADYGLYTLANSLITLFLIDFGLSAAVSRYLSTYKAEGKIEEANRFLGAVYKLYLIIDAIIFVILFILFFLLDSLYNNLGTAGLERFKVVYVIAGLFSVINFPCITFNGILTAHEKFIPLKLSDLIYRLGVVIATIIVLLCGQGLYGLVAVQSGVGLLVVAFKWIIIKKSTPTKVDFKGHNKGIFKEIFSFSLWVTISSLAQRLVFNIMPSLLVMLKRPETVPLFGIITTIEGYAYTITTAINGMFMPSVARYYTEEESQNKIMTLMNKVGRFQFGLNSLIFVGFIFAGWEFLSLWLTEGLLLQIKDAYLGILLVLLPGVFYNSMQIAHTALIVKKEVKYSAFINVGMGVINVILSIPLILLWGVCGACVSIFISYSFRICALSIVYNKKLAINIKQFLVECCFRQGVPTILTIILMCFFRLIMITVDTIILFATSVVVCIILYVALTYLLGLSKDEKIKINKKIFGRLKKTIK